jgi:hypothetical protein
VAQSAAVPSPSAPTLPAQPQTVSQSILDFVKTFVDSGNSGAGGSEIDFYASKVNYFEHGLVDRGFIAADLTRYHEKWPARHYSIVAGPDIAQTPTQGFYSVVYRLEFQVQNTKRGIAGTSLTKMELGQVGNSFLIFGITEMVEKRTPIAGR